MRTTSACSLAWSDTPEWDAVAFMREYRVLHDPLALARAQAAYRFVHRSAVFAGGACPGIPYQRARPSPSIVKTLETQANAVKAALLIYSATGSIRYLVDARTGYARARQYFLDPNAPLYTVHVTDDGSSCHQVRRRFFASVNGTMIWNGVALWKATHDRRYYDNAVATARAVANDLSDSRGVFVDLQGSNDIEEPLVEAMDDLATQEHRAFARSWILRNAAAALSSRARDGAFARFFDGPPHPMESLWESNGGFALQIAASQVDPSVVVAQPHAWQGAYAAGAITSLPATLRIRGSGIALVGTMGASCEHAHVRVFIDGVQTFDRTGLWQNPSMPGGTSVLFAWRWRKAGKHTIVLKPGGAADKGPGHVRLRPYVLR
jgi:hypothetical protein